MIALVAVHVLGKVAYFKKHLQTGSANFSRPALAMTVVSCLAVAMAAIFAVPPTQWIMEQGYEARNSASIVRASPLVGIGETSFNRYSVRRDTNSDNVFALSVYVSFREHVRERPAFAIWAETATGTMIETIYLESELAYSESVTWKGALLRRNHILPIWRNRYTAISNIGPDGEQDGTSGATSTHTFSLDDYLTPSNSRNFVLCVEVNLPKDFDQRWNDPQIGQPSLLYSAYIKADEPQQYAMFELTGHGGGAENNGIVQFDLDEITTAKEIVDLILLKLEK
ncbi:hypothetical protein M4951_05400 [Blastopirellula sp. J2-11]|uniref:hypothetical protein n=1 Tax=Blastopirellula sp. J2-11 TaxID=2943192 RepID=UPI0021C5C01C|nr:hypothetical protein [Blastopirellula sp. J2-11]UUO07745.1 hypothetical protein M4951_05400 [Blastopirellula sp. J2-11]